MAVLGTIYIKRLKEEDFTAVKVPFASKLGLQNEKGQYTVQKKTLLDPDFMRFGRPSKIGHCNKTPYKNFPASFGCME